MTTLKVALHKIKHVCTSTTYFTLSSLISTWQIPEGKEDSVIETAIRAGYRRFDCSRYHGNQAAIGAVLKKLFVEGVVRREDLFITDKFPLG